MSCGEKTGTITQAQGASLRGRHYVPSFSINLTQVRLAPELLDTFSGAGNLLSKGGGRNSQSAGASTLKRRDHEDGMVV